MCFRDRLPRPLLLQFQSKRISDAVKQKERLQISRWRFRDRGILLKPLLAGGRHVEGDAGFGVASHGVYMGLTWKGGRLSQGVATRGKQESYGQVMLLRMIRIKLTSITDL